jgi:hypothetical protein
MQFPEQVAVAGNLIRNFSPSAVVVETNAYQTAMHSTLVLEHPGVKIESHFTGNNKNDPELGVPMLQPIIERGRLRFPYGDFVSKSASDVVMEEFNRYGVAKYSDTLMATWFAVKWLSKFASMGQTKARIHIA